MSEKEENKEDNVAAELLANNANLEKEAEEKARKS